MVDFLITGGSGFVGANLARVFGRENRVAVTYFRKPVPNDITSIQLDICDEQAVTAVLHSLKPKTVIHAAGNKDVKYCEENPGEAARTNSMGTRNVARACHQSGSKMVYISTDLVFDCERGGYRESDIPRPTLVYGETKLAGERWTLVECSDAVICRTAGIYGKNSPLLRWLAGELLGGRPVEAFTDVVNTPTYVDNLAEMIEVALKKNLRGVLHVVGGQRVNRFQFFQSYARVFGLSELFVRPAVAGERRARMLLRPDSSLSNDTTASLLGVSFNSVQEGMERLLRAGGV
ncbi:MAG: dTDP-4-dehydrorhamnose reductase [Acidobacteriota bacterium]|jgi:dTDP-4-dehydrorhamnose reductase|nr:dTDP-4-dehydrorhamnose reductase [Acidobacteriota bacterium]